jgi:transcriptional regulator with XRE-family HTH domain
VQLARELGLSQPRLSQIESGQGSLSAESLLRILRLFNVGVDYFEVREPERAGSAVQNALARHGASHLVESDVLTPSSLDEPIDVAWEVLSHPESTRHLTALAPVLVASVDRIALRELASRLARIGRDQRLGWLLEGLREAIAAAPAESLEERRAAQRADLAAALVLDSGILRPPPASDPPDLLDPDIRTLKSAERVVSEASGTARRWRIATRIQTSDLIDALKAAHASR